MTVFINYTRNINLNSEFQSSLVIHLIFLDYYLLFSLPGIVRFSLADKTTGFEQNRLELDNYKFEELHLLYSVPRIKS